MVVIIGAGIVGSAAAYYLSTVSYLPSDQTIKILDSVGPATASSGKAGAFITNRPPLKRGNVSDKRQAIFEKSFELHQTLAKELNLKPFCRVQNYLGVSDVKENGQTTNAPLLGWLSKIEENHVRVELPGDAAIVDPAELTNSLFHEALSRNEGSMFLRATVRGLELDEDNRAVERVLIERENGNDGPNYIDVDDDEPIVIALGSWSASIEDWLKVPMPIEGVVSTSMVFHDGIPSSDIGTALFLDNDINGCHLELFGRQDKSLYVSGCGESDVVGTEVLRSEERPTPEVCLPNFARASAAQKSLKNLGYEKNKPEVIQACMRPMSPDGVPVIGKIFSNVYVATGGGPWGITWGPLMGKCIGSLIRDEDPPIRMATLKPQRFDTMIYRTLLHSRSPTNKNASP